MKLKIIDFEADKWVADIGCEHEILPRTVRTIVADKQKHKDTAKLEVPGKIKYLRTRENV
jgi:hypothetical protein